MGFVHYDCPDCLTRVHGVPPSRLCPDRVAAVVRERDRLREAFASLARFTDDPTIYACAMDAIKPGKD